MYDQKYSKMAKAVAVQSVKIEVSDSEAEYLEKATKGQTSFNLRYDSEAEYLEKAKKTRPVPVYCTIIGWEGSLFHKFEKWLSVQKHNSPNQL